tara:strand:- start:21847 stop:24234 length:2388 start_codon:yes stop_codon:yes gene_type:complete
MRIIFKAIIAIISANLFLGFPSVSAQTNWCGEVPMTEKFKLEHPEKVQEIIRATEQLEQEYSNYKSERGARAVKVIPVVFHVIHTGGTENISDAQILDQMRILNEDYNQANADLADVVPSFVGVIGNMGIEFRLAQKDPSGNATSGIDRIVSNQTTNGGDAAKLNPWPRSKYLNIWVVKEWNSSIPNGVLAYAYLPGDVVNSPTVDGLIVKSQYVGSIGTGLPIYARTLTHEIGHFLNLWHTWGDSNNPGSSGNCNGDDQVLDTPNCIGTFSCNTSATSCGSLDNVQNHMDYADCTVMFTAGQGTRMNAALSSSVSQRNNLSTPSNLTATGVNQLTSAAFTANRLTICQYERIDFTDQSSYDPTSWAWSFPNGQSGSSTIQNPSESFAEPGLFDVSLTATQGATSVTESKVGYIMVNPMLGKYAPFSEDFSSVTQLNHENWYGINDRNDAYKFMADAANGYSKTPCLRIENFGNDHVTYDELRSTTYDLRMFASVSVSFKVAYARKSNSDLSRLTLYMSDDCGKTWSPKWSGFSPSIANTSITPTAFIPADNSAWKTIIVSNISGSSLAQTSQFRLVWENKNGNNLYLDDFNVSGGYTDIAQLKYPLNGSSAVPNNQIIYWKAMGGGVDSYEYELDTDPAFNSANKQSGTTSFIALTDGLDTQFQPTGLTNGQKYYWRVRLIKSGQAMAWSEVWNFTVAMNGLSTQDILATKYQVKVFPNPMKNNGFVSFSMQKGASVSVVISNIVGQSQQVIKSGYYGEGTHVLNISELHLSAGVYFINLRIGDDSIIQKFIVQ